MDQELCRLCLSKDQLVPIFMDLTQWSKYSDILTQTTGLKIEPYDGLPQSLCKNCKVGITFASNLRNKSRHSELELLKQGYIRSNESDKIINLGATLGCRLPTARLSGWPTRAPPATQAPTITSQLTNNNANIIETKPNKYISETNDSSTDDDDDDDCSNNDSFRDIKIEVKCESLSEEGDGVRRPPLEKMPRKNKREVYSKLVDGDFDPKGPIRCKVCKTTLSGWRCFTSHVQKHLGFKHVCEYCGKSFISSTQLKRHCMSHHGMKRELQCKHCSYLALDNVQLTLHERRMHTGERPYICDHCSASYHSRPCLLQHLESHRTVANVQCELCPRVFKSNRQLSRHRYAAHASRAPCRRCGQHYSLKYLPTHMAKYHADVSSHE